MGSPLYEGTALGNFFQSIPKGPWINVRDFGAQGNGTTDDTTAIQAAMDAGGAIVFPTGDYKVTATLLFKQSSTALIGQGADNSYGGPASRLSWAGPPSSTFVGCNGATAFVGLYISRMLFDANNIDGTKCLNASLFAESCRVRDNVFNMHGSNSRGIYAIANSVGTAPYYCEFADNDFYGSCNGTTVTGSVGIYFDRLLVGGVWWGPNANHIHGGRFSALDQGIWIRAGADNVIDCFNGESNIVDHIRLGDPTADATGTVSSSTKQVVTCTGTPFTANAANSAGAKHVGSVTQYGEVQSNTASAVTMLTPFSTIPVASDTISLWYTACSRNFIRAYRTEGAAGCNGLTIYPGAFGTIVEGSTVQSLGGGKTILSYVGFASEKLNAENWKDPVAIPFMCASVPTNSTLELGAEGGPTRVPILGAWQVVGILAKLDGNITAGSLSIWIQDNGGNVNSAADLILDSNSDQTQGGSNAVRYFPPEYIISAGRSRYFGLSITTSAAFAPITLNLNITVLLQNRG